MYVDYTDIEGEIERRAAHVKYLCELAHTASVCSEVCL